MNPRTLVAVFAAVALGLGCASSTPAAVPPVPLPTDPQVAHQDGTFAGTGGVTLFEQSWRPARGAPRAVLIIVHGLRDHSSRYAGTAEQLAAHGYAVHAFDLRGHGRSGGDRVYVDSFDQYLADLGLFYDRVHAAEPGAPIFLFGHSMGGAIATLFTLTRKPELRGLVLSAPALKPGADVSAFLIGVTRTLGSALPRAGVLSLDPKKFSRDPAVVKENETDPLVTQGSGPARTASALLTALGTIQAEMGDLKTPFLALHGTADVITDPDGSRLLAQKAASSDKTLKLYDGLFHDLLHEPEKAQVYSDLTAWLDARAP